MSVRTALARSIRRGGHRVAGWLPPPRDDAFRAMLRSLRDLALGRSPKTSIVQRVDRGASVASPRKEFASPPTAPLPPEMVWSTPPETAAGEVVKTSGRRAQSVRYDVELFEQLNAEYEDRRLVSEPPSKDPAARHHRAIDRLLGVHRRIGLLETTTLEIGCGEGFEVWLLGTDFGCDAYGIDVRERGSWQALQGDRVHFTCADMSEANPYEADTFDRIVSFAVWEHVEHPYAMLRETYRVLKPGGVAYIRANLFPGPKASHRYREIYFPWPHLLFSDDVIKEWDVKHGRRPLGSSWVNRLSWPHYEAHFDRVGFRLREVRFQEAEWDEDFYQRFRDVLGRYPRTDLGRDFFIAIVEKPE